MKNNPLLSYDFICVFLFGGIIMSLIYYSANVINNTLLSAILALLPLSILSCYVIKTKQSMISHCNNLIPVLLVTLLTVLLLLVLLKYTNINQYLSVTFAILFWCTMHLIKLY